MVLKPKLSQLVGKVAKGRARVEEQVKVQPETIMDIIFPSMTTSRLVSYLVVLFPLDSYHYR